ncbi:MAG: paraslipin [Oculatellaceae cyanobacterium Prado106]|jgi:regulator of protease activity HflC (stomatin/prohibitin superfamily)|nr:paraslipin [Oculatellaceae cyanobacterium Prado106]
MGSLVWSFAIILTILGATVGSTKRVTEGNEALVERLGRYHRKLKPGLNFGIIPFIDEIVVEASIKERILDVPPSDATTRDNIRVKVDAVIFWKILELQQAHYEIQDIEDAIRNLVITTLRSEIGLMDLEETNSSRNKIIRALLESLDEATEPWGVKITRVEIQDIEAPETVKSSLERERAAESERRAMAARASGKKQAAIEEADAIAESVKRIAEAIQSHPNSQHILKYLVARNYVDANLQLGQSNNSKIVFMNPRDLTEGLSDLIQSETQTHQQPSDTAGNGSQDA